MTDFSTGVERLLKQIAHWTESRWRGRDDHVHALVQHLADLAADAEGRPRRPVPRLHPMVLPDQLRVMADDLIGSGAPLEGAASLVDETRHRLS
ncbi:hypothetical protein AB0M54_43430 [Actinoplanes sp. NPDC051470]|uniref:hypothetical protein n=1 Tax=unclassified Actinoplanes TaxID=2626549 RepID=UPI0034353181